MKFLITCREATAWVLQRPERPLAWHERLELRLHQMVCLACRRFAVQADLLEQATTRWRHYREQEPPP